MDLIQNNCNQVTNEYKALVNLSKKEKEDLQKTVQELKKERDDLLTKNKRIVVLEKMNEGMDKEITLIRKDNEVIDVENYGKIEKLEQQNNE